MKLIAHRGASKERPENTLSAFKRALEIGVDWIETDLLATKDRRLVARHGDLIQKDGEWHYIKELTFEELRQIEVGEGERIPSLEMVFDLLKGRCPLMLDLKAFGLAEILVEFLSERKQDQQIHVTSFLHSDSHGRG